MLPRLLSGIDVEKWRPAGYVGRNTGDAAAIYLEDIPWACFIFSLSFKLLSLLRW
jgi:hypothetical protein